MTVLFILTSFAHLGYLLATGLAVEAAVLHNFFWHEHWTWADRAGRQTSFLWRFIGFHLANGAISMVGNLFLMRIFVGLLGIHIMVANVLAIALCSVLNYIAGDKFVFRCPQEKEGKV